VRNVLIKEDGLITLVQLLITQGVPERAGRILLELLESQKIELNEDDWKLLASAWLQSRERKQAIAAFLKAAQFSLQQAESEKGAEAHKDKVAAAKLYYRSAQLQFDESDFLGSIASFAKSRKLGINGKKFGLSLLMQGNAYFELEDYINAKVYFSKALKEASATNGARAWLDYMEQLELF
jgi:tetratricopeptide (TPR) repeat protein